jgi:hypothetical protein
MENKPNFKTKKMTVTKVITKDYRNAPQNRPQKTNPIQTQFLGLRSKVYCLRSI